MTIETPKAGCASEATSADEAADMLPGLDDHLHLVARRLSAGNVVPFLGAGVNLAHRSGPFQQGHTLPSGPELASYLATELGYPSHTTTSDLLRVAQYASLMLGTGDLYEALRKIFNADYECNEVHRFLAELPDTLRAKGYRAPAQLIVTTNYDDVLERAFCQAGEPFEVVRYIADGEDSGKFVHVLANGTENVIREPNNYRQLDLGQRTIILKIHGAVDRCDADKDSYVITEDHYIDYLSYSDISSFIPASLMAKLRESHLLFLGYSLGDWNLRVILRRIWRQQKLRRKSWAVQLHPLPIEKQLWAQRDVEIHDVSLDAYVRALSRRVDVLPTIAPAETEGDEP
jgi:hypothetical protein